jgi:hypothetical protein
MIVHSHFVIFTKPYHSRSPDVKRTSTLPQGETSLSLLRQAHGLYWAKKIFVLHPGATLSHLVHHSFLLMDTGQLSLVDHRGP